MNKRLCSLVLASIVTLGFVGCGKSKPVVKAQFVEFDLGTDKSKTVAVVGDNHISLEDIEDGTIAGDLSRAIKAQQGSSKVELQKEVVGLIKAGRQFKLDELIEYHLVKDELKKLGLLDKAKSVDEALKLFKEGSKDYIRVEECKSRLKDGKITKDGYKTELGGIVNKYIYKEYLSKDFKMTDEILKEYYESRKYMFTRTKDCDYKYLMYEDKDSAETSLKKIKAGKLNFDAEVGKNLNNHLAGQVMSSINKNIDIGTYEDPFTIHNIKVTNGLLKLKEGEISDVIEYKTSLGTSQYIIIKLDAKRKVEVQSFESVKEVLKKELLAKSREETYKAKVEELKSYADIKITW